MDGCGSARIGPWPQGARARQRAVNPIIALAYEQLHRSRSARLGSASVVCRLAAALTCLVLWKWVRVDSIRDSLLLGVAWSAVAIACDYVFLVKLLNPPDGYYKFDVYLYYLLMFALPVASARLRRGAFT